MSADIQTRLFHRVAELVDEHRRKFQSNLEAGKLPVSGLPLRRSLTGDLGLARSLPSVLRRAVQLLVVSVSRDLVFPSIDLFFFR